jgi:hypothetical protein
LCVYIHKCCGVIWKRSTLSNVQKHTHSTVSVTNIGKLSHCMLDINYYKLCQTGKDIRLKLSWQANAINSSQAVSSDKMVWISIVDNVSLSIIMQSLATDHRNILMMEIVTVPKMLEIHSILTHLPAWDLNWPEMTAAEIYTNTLPTKQIKL